VKLEDFSVRDGFIPLAPPTKPIQPTIGTSAMGAIAPRREGVMIRGAVQGISVAGLLCLAGCLHPVVEHVDTTVCDLAAKPWDLQPIDHALPPATPSPSDSGKLPGTTEVPKKPGAPEKEKLVGPPVPPELLPGGPLPRITLPELSLEKDEKKRKQNEEERRQAVLRLLPSLPELSEEPPDLPGPEGRPLTLSDLQKLAMTNSPLIRQAAARVKETQGAAIQAGLPPNPTIGYEGDTMGTTGGPGYQGGFIDQKIIVSNKLQLQRAVATMDLRNAELSLFRAQTDLATRIRGLYFALLVANESVRINRAVVKFTNAIYETQVKQVARGGLGAIYEPMYLRALAVQAAALLLQARNQRIAAWKQLAAAMGLTGMPPTQVAGRIDIPIPLFNHKEVLARALANHSDVRTAENVLQQARFSLELARRTPIPDPDVRLLIQKDRTGPPFAIAPSLSVSIPLPVWDRNQGGIMQAQGVVVRQSEEAHRVRTELARTLAEAFNRYKSNRTVLAMYRDHVLPDLVRAYQGIQLRYNKELAVAGAVGSAPPGFNDYVVAQQNLTGAVATYITTLGQLWQAVVDVADLLQTPDLFGIQTPTEKVAEIPDLEKLPGLPCCHPCSPLPDAHQHVKDGEWPDTDTRTAPVRPNEVLPRPTPVPEKDGDKKSLPPPRVEGVLRPPLLPPASR
jgi:cobalt-zinc-cadmium efflux system outer membrane protein